MNHRPECIVPCADQLGESVVWCPRSRRVWWVDVLAARLHELTWPQAEHRTHDLPFRRIGSIALHAEGGLILATERGVFRWTMEAGVGPCVVPALWNQQTHRLNDGRADRAGRFWVGSMHDTDFTAPDGSLYSFASGGRTHVYETGIIIPNSIAFSPDDRWFYFADTRRYVIWQYAFDLADGQLSNRTVFAEFGNGPARPDGSCMDATGCLWNASYEGARITRFTPTGAVDREIALPVSFPTCVALGGDALDTLFITTAVGPVPYARRAQEPLAGGLFAVNAGVVGLPEPAVGL